MGPCAEGRGWFVSSRDGVVFAGVRVGGGGQGVIEVVSSSALGGMEGRSNLHPIISFFESWCVCFPSLARSCLLEVCSASGLLDSDSPHLSWVGLRLLQPVSYSRLSMLFI